MLLTERDLEFLRLKGGSTGSSESTLCQNTTLLEITCRGSIVSFISAILQWFSHWCKKVLAMGSLIKTSHSQHTVFGYHLPASDVKCFTKICKI